MAAEVDYSDWTAKDWEVLLVVWTMQKFPQGSPGYERIRIVWHACSFSGALREGFPPGTERLHAAWDALVAECRKTAQ